MDVTTVIINYQTPDLLNTAVDSFRKHYPGVNLLLVDNGSRDNSRKVISSLAEAHSNTDFLFFDENIYHGPAMHKVLESHISTPFVFFLDSDTETRKPGFLEEMMEIASAEKVYGVGQTITVNDRGFKSEDGLKVLLTPYMMIKRKLYAEFPPFVHHGQPTIHNFRQAQEAGYQLEDFPISDYIFHHWRGTADRFGYGLGLKGKVDYLLNKLGF